MLRVHMVVLSGSLYLGPNICHWSIHHSFPPYRISHASPGPHNLINPHKISKLTPTGPYTLRPHIIWQSPTSTEPHPQTLLFLIPLSFTNHTLINLTLLETHTQNTGQIPDSFSTAEDLYLSQDGRGRGTDTKTSSEILWSRTDHFNYWIETVFVVESDQRSFYYLKAKIKLWHLPEIELLSSGKEEMVLSGKKKL